MITRHFSGISVRDDRRYRPNNNQEVDSVVGSENSIRESSTCYAGWMRGDFVELLIVTCLLSRLYSCYLVEFSLEKVLVKGMINRGLRRWRKRGLEQVEALAPSGLGYLVGGRILRSRRVG